MCSFALALAGLPLRDYARAGKLRPIAAIVYWLCAAAVLMAAYQATSGKFAALSWVEMGLAGVGLSAAFVGWRWRAMVAAAAFPAGRNR